MMDKHDRIKKTASDQKGKNKKRAAHPHSADLAGAARKAYGDGVTICINADCTLRKKAGGCLGFEGCPGYKAR